MKYLMILCVAYFLGGCIAKSSSVDDIRKDLTDTQTLMNKYHDDKGIEFLINKGIQAEMQGSGIVSEAQVADLIKKGAKLAGAATGWPIVGIVGTGLSLLGFGGIGLIAERKKRRKQLQALGDMNPIEAKKVTDII